jgi:hypothetical protein
VRVGAIEQLVSPETSRPPCATLESRTTFTTQRRRTTRLRVVLIWLCRLSRKSLSAFYPCEIRLRLIRSDARRVVQQEVARAPCRVIRVGVLTRLRTAWLFRCSQAVPEFAAAAGRLQESTTVTETESGRAAALAVIRLYRRNTSDDNERRANENPLKHSRILPGERVAFGLAKLRERHLTLPGQLSSYVVCDVLGATTSEFGQVVTAFLASTILAEWFALKANFGRHLRYR